MHKARIEVTVGAEVTLTENQFQGLLEAALSDSAGNATKADAALYRLSLEALASEDEAGRRALAEELVNATLGRGLRNAARQGIAYACAQSHFGLALDGGPVLLEARDPVQAANDDEYDEETETEATEENAE